MLRLFLLLVILGGRLIQSPLPQSTVDERITATLTEYNTRPQLEYTYREVERHPTPITDSGIVYLELISIETGEPVEGLIELMAIVDGQAWLPGQAGYDAAFANLPVSVRLGIDTSPYRPQPDPAHTPDTPYGLPYPHGAFGTVTRSYATHGTGAIDFDLTGRDVAAAKDGTVIYANDRHQTNGAWWYWNLVIIQHTEHEYSLYGHLAPNSIPAAILSTCNEHHRCDYPIQRGDVLGWEGNTGRSINPHLHVEFGQQVGFVSFPDFADDDRDGNRFEPVPTAFVYAEQDVSFQGYPPNNVALWDFGRLEQAAHTAPIPADANALQNGDFASGTDGWTPIGQLNWQVDNGVLRATRLRTSAPPDFAAFYQDTGFSAYADQPLQLTLLLGNDSAIAKTATVELINASGRQYGAFGCDFTIAPNTPLQPYTVSGTAGSTWADVRVQISVNPADGSPALLVDDVSLRQTHRRASVDCL